MPRDIPVETLRRLRAPSVSPLLLVDFHFNGGTLSVTSAMVNYNWSGKKYQGAGYALRQIRFDRQGDGLTPVGVTFGVAASSRRMMDAFLGEQFLGREADIYFGLADTRSADLIRAEGLPFPILSGEMSAMPLRAATLGRGVSEIQISLKVTSPLARWSAAPNAKYSAQQQRELYPAADPADASFDWRLGTLYH